MYKYRGISSACYIYCCSKSERISSAGCVGQRLNIKVSPPGCLFLLIISLLLVHYLIALLVFTENGLAGVEMEHFKSGIL